MIENMIISMTYILGFVGILAVGLSLAMPIGRRLAAYPDRPMTEGESRATWAVKYHQATRVKPNTHPWPWIEKQGTEIQSIHAPGAWPPTVNPAHALADQITKMGFKVDQDKVDRLAAYLDSPTKGSDHHDK
jgi:hypothetical protein